MLESIKIGEESIKLIGYQKHPVTALEDEFIWQHLCVIVVIA